ncbi:hypothetical protein PN498_17305 [Oscillatoria sp. CS-180]|uniref:alr0857 family protein n=1 Tax=Oscillatoria sp. CS-180 TaxID=3021720 RepID=UPI0023310288|nr:alr0857 family protein [Oscillatoria sp. CS-180]MDB9527756.1 hypothetical protein [Oscillatoria sp. CS-180]
MFLTFGVSMLKVTYADTGICLEYCVEPLDLLLSDRVRMYVHARRAVSIQPTKASIPFPAALINQKGWEQFQSLDWAWCDQDWLEITLSGVWLTEEPNQEIGIFLTELDLCLEQRLLRLWQRSQRLQLVSAIDQGVTR